MKLNITPLQWVGIIILFNSTLIGGASQLGHLSLSPNMVQAILAVATLGNGFLGGLVSMFGSQASMVQSVQQMDSVDRIVVNAQANHALAQLAVDPEQRKVEVAPGAAMAVAKTAGTLAQKVVSVLLVAFALSFLLAGSPAEAQSRPRLPIDPLGLNDRPMSIGKDPLENLLGALDAKLLPDLQYALKLANASGSRVTAPCYQAWIDIIQVRQKAVQDEKGQDLPMPDPAIITKFERMVELRNSLQPDSEFMIKCSPVASMVKKDIVGFIGVVLTGGAGLATMVPGL